MLVYEWMNTKKYDIHILIISSLFISYMISIFYTVIHNIIFTNYNFNEATKSLIYIISGLIFSLIVIFFQNTKFFKKILRFLNHKSSHNDIFDDVIDYKTKTLLQIYIKNSPVMYIGTFKIREEKGIDSYIVLVDYVSLNATTKEALFNPSKNNLKSSVLINLRDIERIEIIYNNDDFWGYLTK